MKQIIITLILIFFFSSNIKIFDSDEYDRIENLNRRIYAFNRGIDYILINPIIKIYINVVPEFLKNRINNFFRHANELQNILIYLIVLDRKEFYLYINRIIINSTLGLLGIFDVAAKMKIPYKTHDLDKILLFYKSRYMILPIIGPGSFKNNIFLLSTQIFNPYIYIFNNMAIYYLLEIINERSKIMLDNDFFYKNMIDGYSFLKDIYMQNIIKNSKNEN